MKNNLYISAIKLTREIPKDNYLRSLPVIKNLRQQGEVTFDKPITFLVGENGIGKSTLIEAIAVNFGFNPEGGTKNYNFHTKSSHSSLSDFITLVKTYNYAKSGYFLRAESFYNTISYVDYLDEERNTDNDYFQHIKVAETNDFSMHNMSHGESFLNAISEFKPNGLYILDEPEAALSPMGIMKLMSYMDALVKKNCQFIISTHSPMLMAMPNSDVYQLSKENIEKVPFRETEHYTLTRRFLENPDKMLKYLLDANDEQ
ncbi:MAG: AAA family ATPase [Clostridia bacterium]|nr:AAA family ATPase [Clostridia bacterium]